MDNTYTDLERDIMRKSEIMNIPINGLELEALTNVITKCMKTYSYTNTDKLIEISLKGLRK